MTDLAVATDHTEKQLLTDATTVILAARAEIERLKAEVDELDIYHMECTAREKAERERDEVRAQLQDIWWRLVLPSRSLARSRWVVLL